MRDWWGVLTNQGSPQILAKLLVLFFFCIIGFAWLVGFYLICCPLVYRPALICCLHLSAFRCAWLVDLPVFNLRLLQVPRCRIINQIWASFPCLESGQKLNEDNLFAEDDIQSEKAQTCYIHTVSITLSIVRWGAFTPKVKQIFCAMWLHTKLMQCERHSMNNRKFTGF